MIEKFGIIFAPQIHDKLRFSRPEMCHRFFGIHIVFCKKEPVFIEFKIFENRFFYLL